ncbi:MAG: PDZ domain-containing protein [Verrucomicrobiota bacterium]
MKRAIAILIIFTGLNVLIFWITSFDVVSEEAEDDPLPLSETAEKPQPALLAPEDTLRAGRSLLLGDVSELMNRKGETYQKAASSVIPSIVRVRIIWRGENGAWESERVGGVCVDKNGYYVAPWNRLSKGEAFQIEFQDKTTVAAVLEGMDPASDLALLKATPRFARPIKMSNAMAAPFGNSMMFIWLNESAKPRSQIGHLNGIIYEYPIAFPEAVVSYVQSDILVSINEVGGCLIDLDGRLLGMLTRAPDTGRDFVPMISAEQIRHIAEQLKQKGFVARSGLGLMVQDLVADLRTAFGFSEETRGLVVTQVVMGSPAEIAGIQEGDLVTQINETKAASSGFFRSIISRWPLGKEVQLTVIRNGETLEVRPIASVLPVSSIDLQIDPEEIDYENFELVDDPLEAISIKDQKVSFFESEVKKPVVVQINLRQAIFAPELLPGDVLLGVNNTAVGSVEEIRQIRGESSDKTDVFLLQCYRDGKVFWSAGKRP